MVSSSEGTAPDGPELNTLSIFTGIGGLDLGVSAALEWLGCRARSAGYCECESYCQAILMARMEETTLGTAPIWVDIADIPGDQLRGLVDLLIAGPPCQPVSKAGLRKGAEDKRWLWPSLLMLVAQIRPSITFFENVDGFSSRAGGLVTCLESLGYTVAPPLRLRAPDVGSPQKQRMRVFVMAVHDSARCEDDAQSDIGATAEYQASRWRDLVRCNPELGRTPEPRHQELAATKRKREQPGGECGGVGTADHKPVRGIPSRDRRRRPEGENRDTSPHLALYPPSDGEGALDAWAELFRAGRVDLAPALPQSAVHQLVDGSAAWAGAIRAIGNSCIPLQAAVAFIYLWNILWTEREGVIFVVAAPPVLPL